MDDLRYRPQQPGRNNGPRLGPGALQPQASSLDPRSHFPRRFTTDSGRVPTLSSLAPPPRLPDQNQDYVSLSRALVGPQRFRLCYEFSSAIAQMVLSGLSYFRLTRMARTAGNAQGSIGT